MNDIRSKEIAVSVICITYNHVNYIADALDGVIRQKVSFPIEVIVHDDASTDGTADIIREIAVVATFVFFNPSLYKYFIPEYFIYPHSTSG